MDSAETRKCINPQRVWERTASQFVHAVDRVFYLLGVFVAKRPWPVIGATIAFLIFSSLGFFRFHLEKNPMKLWVPPESDFYVDTEWYMNTFGSGFRLQQVLITADNVLDPQVLWQLSEIYNEVRSIRVQHKNKTYSIENLCFKVPVVSFNVQQTGNGNGDISNSFFDPSDFIPTSLYCLAFNNLKRRCYEMNMLDLWYYDDIVIANVTKDDILNQISTTHTSPTTGHPMDFVSLLGGITRDASGNVISAKSLLTTWFLHVDFATVDLDETGNLVGTEEWGSLSTLLWEAKYLDIVSSFAANATGMNIFYQAGRSFGDISGATMFQEMDKLFLGIALMFVYIQVIMSGFNWLEIRLTLGGVGLMCVGMAYVAACSWCSILGIPYGPVHASLPFLLMGLGIDDMFVMKACWEQLSEEERNKPLPVQVGLMLQHAGVSIVITSFTDIVAFLIGSITILPSLRSFCFYAAAGVFFIFCFSVTFYVAVFTLDVRRIKANRNGLLFCYKHKTVITHKNEKTLFQRMFASFYSNFIFSVPMKVMIIAFTIVMSAFSMEAVLRLEQRFDPDWFIPDDTYFKEFLNEHKYYYPNEGKLAFIFMGEMNYTQELPNLYELAKTLRKESYVTDMMTWVEGLHTYASRRHVANFSYSNPSEEDFHKYLSEFLFSPSGGRFQQSIKFTGNLTCGSPVPPIRASSFQFKFPRFNGPSEYIPAMNNLKRIVREANITTGDGYRSVWSKVFANWVTDEIIDVEVERNVELALLCVMGCTIFLITDLQMCLWIFICVLLTLVNVCGWMQRWGMTIDIVSCIGLELAIGLCVDYAAHVGHTFLTMSQGNRQERSLRTVTSIGMAVLYGGGATLLSLSLLSMSKAYTFNCFFKIFLLVIFFGLFNGLVFLPVVLSLVGPKPYVSEENIKVPKTELDFVDKNGMKLPETELLNESKS